MINLLPITLIYFLKNVKKCHKRRVKKDLPIDVTNHLAVYILPQTRISLSMMVLHERILEITDFQRRVDISIDFMICFFRIMKENTPFFIYS